MIRFLVKRTLRALIALYLFITFVFFFTQLVIPGDFTTQFAMGMNRAAREALQKELGLDLPIWQQYLNWLHRLLAGSLGTSFYGYSVTASMKAVLPPTLLIFLTGTVIAFFIGQWLGKWTAWRGPGPVSGASTFSAIALYTSFPPWLAFLMVYFFVRRFELFPSALFLYQNPLAQFRQRLSESSDLLPNTLITYMLLTMVAALLVLVIGDRVLQRLWRRRLPLPVSVILLPALAVGSWFAFGFGAPALQIMHLAGLPILTFVLLSLGETMLIMQTTMKDTLGEEYIRVARAKGLPEHMVRDKHAARNAVIPVFSRLVVSLPYLLTGIVIIERAVNWPGMGEAMLLALYNKDTPVVMGALLIIGAISSLARLVLDVVQLYIDPRMRDRAIRMGDLGPVKF
ncbi:MAG: ABC transporter permease [Anaerolineae bacterium]